MSDRDFDIDLFGEALVQPQEGRGRPEFGWSLERSNKVLLAFAAGGSQADAASAIGCDVKTLRKHFSLECDERKRAAHRLEIEQLARLDAEARKGSVAAIKALDERLEKLRLRRQAVAVRDRKAPAKPVRKGVKEERQDAAQNVGGRFAPRPAPGEMVQ